MKNAELDAGFKTLKELQKIYSAKNFYYWVQKCSAYDYNRLYDSQTETQNSHTL